MHQSNNLTFWETVRFTTVQLIKDLGVRISLPIFRVWWNRNTQLPQNRFQTCDVDSRLYTADTQKVLLIRRCYGYETEEPGEDRA